MVTAPKPTWRSGKAWAVLLVVTLLALAADLGTKEWAFNRVAGSPVVIDREEVLRTGNPSDQIPLHNPVVVVPKVLEFTLVANRGAVFGLGAGQRGFFIVFTMIALVLGVLLFCFWTRPREYVSHVAIALLLAGGIGNLYDRVFYACVRDFIHPLPRVKLPFGWTWPWGGRDVWPYVSNVADLFLIVGIGILVVKALREPGPPKKVAKGEGAGAGGSVAG
ncbi:MAG TPA: signal peptidase II [Phycisphaerales bacterium]|nr:signal peptidase II [Phycisphaerales bacterium]